MSERDLDRRLAELEARCRRLQALTASPVCIVVAGGLAGWAAARPSVSGADVAEVTRTQRVELVDSAGRRAADLSADASGVEIRLFRPDVELERIPGGDAPAGELIDARVRITHGPGLVLTDGADNVIEGLGVR